MNTAQAFSVICLDRYVPYSGNSEGTGRGKKVWLRSPGGLLGLFKYPKTDPAAMRPTTEHISEHLASQLGMFLGVSTAKVDIAEYGGDIGSISYDVRTPQEALVEGAVLIQRCFPDYTLSALTDESSGARYCLDFLFQSVQPLSSLVPEEAWLEMIIFDFLIGNSDRHPGNWALLFHKPAVGSGQQSPLRPCPLYDNGSSLCSYVNEKQVGRYFGPDPGPFNALCDSKSRSIIRIDGTVQAQPRHSEVVRHLLRTYPAATREICMRFVDGLPPEAVDSLLSLYPATILNEQKNELIRRFLKRKLSILETLLKEEA